MTGASVIANTQGRIDEILAFDISLSKSRFEKAELLVGIAAVGDIAMIFGGLVMGFWIRFRSGWINWGNEPTNLVFWDYSGLIGLGALFLVLTFAYMQLYSLRTLTRFQDSALIIFKGTMFWLFAFLGLNLVMKFQPAISRMYLFSSYLTCLVAVLTWRWFFQKLLQQEAIASTFRQRILFVGWTREAQRITELVNKDATQPYEVVGWIAAPLQRREVESPRSVPELGDCTQLTSLLQRHQIDVVVLADIGLVYEEVVGLANICEKQLVQFKIIPSYFQILLSGLRLEPISGVPILGVSELPLDRPINRVLKRAVDVLGALVGLIGALPIMVVCGILIWLESPGPIFFVQERLGRNGQRFRMFKLRSMSSGAESSDHVHQSTQRNDSRVLKIGRIMRQWNLDETPQFWNVLRGDMSLVGPRPERTYHSRRLGELIPHYNARLASKPGLTGWAQVNGLRGDTSLEERVRFDLHYLENWSLMLDFQTMLLTFFRRQNAY